MGHGKNDLLKTNMLYSYIVARDYGFAPNPFSGFCTLATCKPKIRKAARIDDWILGTGSKKHGLKDKIIFFMRVTEKIDFNSYWNDPRFFIKRPFFNKSLKFAFGDNIYHQDSQSGEWVQENSHHSYEDGKTNKKNLETDTKGEFVLISSDFYYFGRNAINIPDLFLQENQSICVIYQGYKNKFPEKFKEKFLNWFFESVKEKGYLGDPVQFEKFERYKGA